MTLDALESDDDGNLVASTGETDSENPLGIAVESISEDQRSALGDPDGGVLIQRVESDEAYRAGLRRGDVLLMINSAEVSDLDDFNDIVEDLEPGKAVALRIMRQGVTNFIAFTPSDEDSD